MRYFGMLAALLLIAITVAIPAVLIAQPVIPETPGAIVDAGKNAVAAGVSHQWWYMSSLICLVIMGVLKITKLLEKVGRWKYVILPVLALAAALLAAFQGGVGITVAIGVFTTSWAMGMLEELWNHGILGKPHTPGSP